MSDLLPSDSSGDAVDSAPVAPPPKRGPGHRGQDIRDTMAEMAAKAHEISLEAGSKMASAMRDVIGAAAGISAFAIESARDLVNYMVRRGQMSQDEATRLLREVEAAHAKRPKEALKKVEAPPARGEIKILKTAKIPAEKAAPNTTKAAAPKPAAMEHPSTKETAPAKSAKPEKASKGEKPAAKAATKPEKASAKPEKASAKAEKAGSKAEKSALAKPVAAKDKKTSKKR